MITTKHFLIRPIKDAEYHDLLKIYQVKENMQFIANGKYDWSLEELKKKWKKMEWSDEKQYGFLIIILKLENKIIGECGYLKRSASEKEELEIAYLIDHKYWGNGFGTEICKALINYGFSTLRLQRMIAGMYKANTASAAVSKKSDMQLIKEGVTPSGIAFQEYEIKKIC